VQSSRPGHLDASIAFEHPLVSVAEGHISVSGRNRSGRHGHRGVLAHNLVDVSEPRVPDPAPGSPDVPGPRDVPGAGADPELIDLATKIFNLARGGDSAAIAAYVDARVPVDLTNDKGDSLLMLAAYHGHAATVAALLERGADPGRPNDRGQTPLAGAVFKKEPQIARLLLDAGADPAAGHPSAADTAAMFGNEDFLAWFAGH